MDGKIPEWVEPKLLSILKSCGVMTDESEPVMCILKTLVNDGLCSCMYSADIECGQRKYSLMVKVLQNWNYEYFKDMFINEYRMYQSILPALAMGNQKFHSLIPKYYCGYVELDRAMLVMENLSTQGFRHPTRTMDMDHLCFSLKALGRFHAFSYAAKKNNPSWFRTEVVDQIYGAHRDEFSKLTMGLFTKESILHVVELFLTRFPKDTKKHAETVERLEKVIDHNIQQQVMSAMSNSSLAVVCHGDFTRNNLMLRYGDDGQIEDIKFLDLQLSQYSSPIVDISTIISINTSPELREKHLDDMLSVYYGAVVESLAELLACSTESLVEEFSLRAFQEEYNKGAMYGFCIASFFTHAALEGSGFLPILGVDDVITTENCLQSMRDKWQTFSEEVKRRLAALMKEQLEKNYLEPHISTYNRENSVKNVP